MEEAGPTAFRVAEGEVLVYRRFDVADAKWSS